MIITIDGPAGSGKSTVAEEISKKLNFIHFNSGSLYRGVAAYLLSKNFDFSTLEAETIVDDFDLKTEYIDNVQHVYVNNIDFTSKLRENEVSINSAKISICKFIRSKIDNCQRNFAKENSIVIEGRDVGSHVFPNAEFKFYLDCSLEERANRRFKEEQSKNSKISYDELKQQIKERDEKDKNRTVAPLVVPKNAIIVDSTNLTVEQVVDTILSYIK